MRVVYTVMLLASIGATAAFGQQSASPTMSGSSFHVSNVDVAAGYNYIRANAPPSDCQCFNMNGAFVSADVPLWNWLGVTGKVTLNHGKNISDLGQNLTLMTFAAGPKVSLPMGRFIPFGEILFGVARGTGSYFPSGDTSSSSASSFALAPGGGVDIGLTPRFAIRAEAQYLRTSLPNGFGNTQNQLQIGTGIVFRFGGSGGAQTEVVSAPPPRPVNRLALGCSVSSAEVVQGNPLQVICQAMTLPGNLPVNYGWTINGQSAAGTGPVLSVDTNGLTPGTYNVVGHAALTDDPATTSESAVTFRIDPKPAPAVEQAPPSAPPVNTPSAITDQDFSENTKPIFFDYDKWEVRPDAQSAIAQDAAYLAAHPELQITVAGFADERGTNEFNLELGLKRATAMREALIQSGIAGSRILIVSYGKDRPICTENTDACFQENRRAQIQLQH